MILWLTIGVALVWITWVLLANEYYLSQTLLEAAEWRVGIASVAVVALYQITSMGLIAKQVDYRFRDGLMALIPIYSYVFMVRMLWRWASLPDRPWDDHGWDRIEGPGAVELADGEPRVSRRPIVIGGLGTLALAVWIALFSIQPWAPDQRGWRTTEASGVSVSLPATFVIFTDPDEMARAVMEGNDPSAEAFADLIRQFPEFFVLFASEVSEEGRETGSFVLVLRVPSFGVPFEELVSSYEVELDGYDLASPVSRRAVNVGVSGHRAVRFDYEERLPGFLSEVHSADFVVDGGTQAWILQSVNPADGWERSSSRLDRIVASLVFT